MSPIISFSILLPHSVGMFLLHQKLRHSRGASPEGKAQNLVGARCIGSQVFALSCQSESPTGTILHLRQLLPYTEAAFHVSAHSHLRKSSPAYHSGVELHHRKILCHPQMHKCHSEVVFSRSFTERQKQSQLITSHC